MNLRPLNRRPFEPSGPLQSSRRTCHILYVIFRCLWNTNLPKFEFRYEQGYLAILKVSLIFFVVIIHRWRNDFCELKLWNCFHSSYATIIWFILSEQYQNIKKRIENEYINNGAKDATLWNVFFTLPGITVLTLNYHSQICTFISVYVSIATHTVGQRKTKEKHIL